MKAVKGILLTILSIFLVVSALFLQVNLALNLMVFSGVYFSAQFDHNVKPADMEKFSGLLSDSKSDVLPPALLEAIDGKWLAKEVPNLAKGMFAYFTGSAKKLPSIGIAPLKEAMVDSYVDQFLAGSGGSPKEFDALIAQIELTSGGFVRDGKVNGAAVSQFMQMGQIMGMPMSEDTAEDICLKIGNRDKDGSTIEELYEYTVKAVAADMMDGSGMNDKLDFGLLVNSAYGTKSNPVSGFPAMFGSLRTDIMLLSALLFLLLAGAMAAIAWRKNELLRWLGVPLIVSGVLGLVLPVLTLLLRPQIAAAFSGESGSAALMAILRNWALSYAGGVTIYLFVQCLAFVALGWVLLVLARKAGSGRHAARKSGDNGLLRAVVAVVLIAAIPFSAFLIGKDVMRHVDSYDKVIKAAAKQKNLDFGGALMKALGVEVP